MLCFLFVTFIENNYLKLIYLTENTDFLFLLISALTLRSVTYSINLNRHQIIFIDEYLNYVCFLNPWRFFWIIEIRMGAGFATDMVLFLVLVRLFILDNMYNQPFKCRSQWQPTPVLLPGKSHGQRSLVGCSPWGHQESDTTEQLHFHFSLSCIREGNGNSLQCSCLENPRDQGAWWTAICQFSSGQFSHSVMSDSL